MRITPDTGILVRMNAEAIGPARRLLDVILDGPHELVLPEFLAKRNRPSSPLSTNAGHL
jgi:hypothetical protein